MIPGTGMHNRSFLLLTGFLLTLALLAACAEGDSLTPVRTPLPETPAGTAAPTVMPAPSQLTSTPMPPTPTLFDLTRTSERPAATATGQGPVATPSPPPTHGVLILSFAASPTEVDPGDSITLTWETTGDTAALYTVTRGGVLGNMQTVEPSGSLTLEIPASARNTVTYMLSVSHGEVNDAATVTVTIRCPDAWFFDNPPDACPQAPPLESPAAYQAFERGFMIWLGAVDRIYILFDDEQYPPVQIVTDLWEEGLPEYDPTLIPPEGLYQPIRGFGLAWRGDEQMTITVRDRIGWALQPENSYTAFLQCDSPPKYITCYLLDPFDQVIVLEPESSGWTSYAPDAP